MMPLLAAQPGRIGARQQFHRPLIPRAGAHRAVQPWHRLGVVVEHVRPGLEDRVQRIPVPTQVGNEDLDPGAGDALAQSADRGREMRGAAVGQVVARHGGDDHETQPHAGGGIGQPARLVGIGRGEWLRALDVAEAAPPRAPAAADHEGGRAPGPAAADVGTGRLLAHGGEGLIAHEGLQADVSPREGVLRRHPSGQAATVQELQKVAGRHVHRVERRNRTVADQVPTEDDVGDEARGVRGANPLAQPRVVVRVHPECALAAHRIQANGPPGRRARPTNRCRTPGRGRGDPGEATSRQQAAEGGEDERPAARPLPSGPHHRRKVPGRRDRRRGR